MIAGSVLLGRAVLGYFTHVRSALKLAQDLREYSREDLIRDLDFLYRKSALPFKHQFALGLVGVYGIGLAEIDLSLSDPTLDKLADHYAGQFMDYIHTTAVRDAADAYTAMINRGTPRKTAAERVKKFFGTTARGFTTMINQWSKKPEKSTGSRTIREDLRDDTALKVAAKDLLNRIASIQDSESWHAKESIKNTAWRIAVDKKMLPKTAEKEWITADDELVCRVCGPLHHKRVLVGEPFKLSDGRELWAPGVHPNCRCELKIRVRISLKPAQLVSKSRDNSDIRRLPDGTFAPSGQGQVRYAQDRPRTVRVAEREQLGSEFDQLKDVERLAAEPATRQWDNPWADKTEDLWSKKAANPWGSEGLFSGKTENPWAIKENPVSTEGPAFSAKENPFDNKKDLFDTKANPFDVSRKFSWIQPRENPFTGSKDHYNTWFSGTGIIIEGEVEEVEQTNLQKLEEPVYAVFDYYMIDPEIGGEYLDPDVRDERVKWVASMRFTSNPYKVKDDMIDMIASGENHEYLVDGYDQQSFTVSAHQLGGNLKTALADDYDPDREYRIPEETFSAMVWYSLISLAYETVGDTNRLEIYEREMSNPSSEDNWGDIIDYGDFNMEDDAIRDRAMIVDLAKKTGLYNEIVDAYNEGYLMSPGVAMIDEVDPNYDDIHGGYEEMEMTPRTEINPDSFLDFPMGDPDVWEGSVVPMYKLGHFKMDSEGRL